MTSNTQYCYITGFSISFFPVTNYGLLSDVDFLVSPISLVLLNIEIVMENYKISRIYTKKVVKVALTSGINNCWLKIRGCTFIAAENCAHVSVLFSVTGKIGSISMCTFIQFTWYKYYHTVGLSV